MYHMLYQDISGSSKQGKGLSEGGMVMDCKRSCSAHAHAHARFSLICLFVYNKQFTLYFWRAGEDIKC